MAKKIYSTLLTPVLFFVASNSFAASLVTCGNDSNPANQCTYSDLVKLVTSVISFALVDIAMPITVVMIIWGGIKMATSAGNEGKFKEGRKIITAAAIGLVMALGAWLIVQTILKFAGLPAFSE
jgi:hypothetical protein